MIFFPTGITNKTIISALISERVIDIADKTYNISLWNSDKNGTHENANNAIFNIIIILKGHEYLSRIMISTNF